MGFDDLKCVSCGRDDGDLCESCIQDLHNLETVIICEDCGKVLNGDNICESCKELQIPKNVEK